MEAVRSPQGVFGTPAVQERTAGGNKRQADAFRQALRQRDGDESGAATAAEEAPVRTGLQPMRRESRRDGGTTAGHVDVIA